MILLFPLYEPARLLALTVWLTENQGHSLLHLRSLSIANADGVAADHFPDICLTLIGLRRQELSQ